MQISKLALTIFGLFNKELKLTVKNQEFNMVTPIQSLTTIIDSD